MIGAIGAGIVHAAIDGDGVGIDVADAQVDVGVIPQVEMTGGGSQGYARPGFSVPGMHAEGGLLAGKRGVGRAGLNQVKARAEVEKHLVGGQAHCRSSDEAHQDKSQYTDCQADNSF